MEKVSLLSGAKFSGKSETPKTSSTPKLEFMKTLSSKLSPDTIKTNIKPIVSKSEPSKPVVSKPTSTPVVSKPMSAPPKPHTSQGGASAVVNAEKKLQMMKKKAAAKLQEKRASLK